MLAQDPRLESPHLISDGIAACQNLANVIVNGPVVIDDQQSTILRVPRCWSG